MKSIRFGQATHDEIDNALDGMRASPESDPARDWGRLAMENISQEGIWYVFNSDDPRAIRGLEVACETVINIDGYEPEEALQFSAIKRSCHRILRELKKAVVS